MSKPVFSIIMIICKNVSKVYSNIKVIDSTSVTFSDVGFYLLSGESGSGIQGESGSEGEGGTGSGRQAGKSECDRQIPVRL